MSSPVEAENLQNPDESVADNAEPGTQDDQTSGTAMQQSDDPVDSMQPEQDVGDEAPDTSPAPDSATEAEADVGDVTAQNAEGDETADSAGLDQAAAVQPTSTDDTDIAGSSERLASSSGASASQEGYYPDQEDRPIWASAVSTADTQDIAESTGLQTLQQQEDLEERPSSREDAIDSNAESALQPSGASAAIQAALSNPEMDPDHPLLQRAQKALEKQLLATKYRLESEVREKSIALQVCPQPLPSAAGTHAQSVRSSCSMLAVCLTHAADNHALNPGALVCQLSSSGP